ncbi:hypothetical protein [Endozoicomonas sp. OPT23]|uniref:hypothetical protein n=1 Tax=Endozoicomonas sp. OPT23 TaxID=2072845 RepID=UPI00129B05B5|nr:hypothetical protein [Endozoicomonas sp. OPT23]
MRKTTNSWFLSCWLSAILLFFILGCVSLLFQPYQHFPAYGFIGYALSIILLLLALTQSQHQWHYLVVSMTLIIFGAIAGFDIVFSSEEIAHSIENHRFISAIPTKISAKMLDDYINILVLILNIFTGSLAANSLFYGLNKRHFK